MRKGISSLPKPVVFRGEDLLILDQTALPAQERYVSLKGAKEVARAIKMLMVRGAPWIGVVAGYGLAIEAQRLRDKEVYSGLKRAAKMLVSARPTAVNLSWAVNRIMMRLGQRGLTPKELRAMVRSEAEAIAKEEEKRSVAIAEYGAKLVPKNGKILTICNTGVLAGPGLGTALGVIYSAHLQGKRPFVYVCETRPLLQGARLTCWELMRAGVDFVLMVDSAAAGVIDRCDLVLVGADRIAQNGDTANKVGTRMLALLAKDGKKPFYVVAPSSTFDPKIKNGSEIVIEERKPDEVLRCAGYRVKGRIKVFNPAFDITPAGAISGFITEAGVVRPPFKKGIRRLFHSVVTKTLSISTGGFA